jgi:hypothetical protein
MSADVVEVADVVGSGWAERELEGVNLGDQRLNRRLVEIAKRFFEKPLASIPQATGDWAEAKGAYRFMDNEKVEPDAILEPHRLRTIERAAEHELVLAVGDTTMLDYTRHPATTGLGPLSDLEHQGLLLHPTLVVTPERVPLGLIHHFVWTRDEETFALDPYTKGRLPIEKKESLKWLVSLSAAEKMQRELAAAGAKTRVVAVFDREGDVYDVFAVAASTNSGCELLVRAKNDRRVDHALGHLWRTMEAQPRTGTATLSLPRTPKRKAREADLTVRFVTLALLPPEHRAKPEGLRPVEVQLVFAHEESPPKGEEPVSWMLITTLPVSSFEDACRILSYYTCRWVVELLIRVTKSGCKAEERQLETADRLKRCLALDLIVAWRVLYLTTIGRETPNLPCTVIFEDHEWRSLYLFVLKKAAKVPKSPPTLRDVTRLIGKLGGHLGRKSDKEPGQTVMWRGLSRLSDISGFFLIMESREEESPDSGP